MPNPFEKLPEVRLVRVRSFTGRAAQLEADLGHNILDVEGIPSVVQGKAMADALSGADAVHLLVREADSAEAQEILEGYLDRSAT